MRFPYIENIKEGKEMATAFLGYNHTNKCIDGQFYEMRNMISDGYPFLGVSKRRRFYRFGILCADKNSFTFIDSQGRLYADGRYIGNGFDEREGMQIVRMGSYVCVFPHGKYVNISEQPYEIKSIKLEKEFSFTYDDDNLVQICQCDSNLNVIHPHRRSDYTSSNKPKDGDYLTETSENGTVLKQYSYATGMWVPVTGTYIRIRIEGTTSVFQDFNTGDGVKVYCDINNVKNDLNKGFKTEGGDIKDDAYDVLKSIFINQDNTNNYVIRKREETSRNIYIPGILPLNGKGSNFYGNSEEVFEFYGIRLKVTKPLPNIKFAVECQNRVWACDYEGREIYASKLGDLTNWNTFEGISTDSYAASIGSDGEFTGACTYRGYPYFFKQTSAVRVSVSPQGAHQVKEFNINGVQNGSHESISEMDGLLYYKSPTCVCVFDGQNARSISDALGAVTYMYAVGGTINGKYIVDMASNEGRFRFIYDSTTSLWTKLDSNNTNCFLKCEYFSSFEIEHVNELLACTNQSVEVIEGSGEDYIFDDQTIYESYEFDQVEWHIESGRQGFEIPNHKNLSRISVRMTLENDSNVSFQIKYDSMGDFQTVWQMYGRGTKTFTIPMKPHRCDHYQYRLVGRGNAEIISITKTYTEGSDM